MEFTAASVQLFVLVKLTINVYTEHVNCSYLYNWFIIYVGVYPVLCVKHVQYLRA